MIIKQIYKKNTIYRHVCNALLPWSFTQTGKLHQATMLFEKGQKEQLLLGNWLLQTMLWSVERQLVEDYRYTLLLPVHLTRLQVIFIGAEVELLIMCPCMCVCMYL